MKTECIQAKAKLALWQQLTLFKIFSLWTKLKNIAFFSPSYSVFYYHLEQISLPTSLPFTMKKHLTFFSKFSQPSSHLLHLYIQVYLLHLFQVSLKTSLWAGLPHEVLNFCARAGCSNLKIFSRGYYSQEVSVLLLILFSYTFVHICGNKKHFNVITRSKWRTISNRK